MIDHHDSPSFGIDVREALKQGLRRFARSVAIISCSDDDRKYAMTATAVSELSLDPPSMLVCINKSSSIHRAMSNGAGFYINVLSRSQESISALCGGKACREDRFIHPDWRFSPEGVPFLASAAAVFQCRQRQRLAFGTHEIFIGEVIDVALASKPDPLLYVGGRYAGLAEPEIAGC